MMAFQSDSFLLHLKSPSADAPYPHCQQSPIYWLKNKPLKNNGNCFDLGFTYLCPSCRNVGANPLKYGTAAWWICKKIIYQDTLMIYDGNFEHRRASAICISWKSSLSQFQRTRLWNPLQTSWQTQFVGVSPKVVFAEMEEIHTNNSPRAEYDFSVLWVHSALQMFHPVSFHFQLQNF